MRKTIIVSVCVVFVGASLCWLTVCSKPVSSYLSERVRRGQGTVIDFVEAAPFSWDRLYIFGPYTSAECICNRLGFDWQGVSSTSIRESETVNLLVFVKGQEVVHWFEYPRSDGELEGLVNQKGYSRKEAKFQVHLGADNRLALIPK